MSLILRLKAAAMKVREGKSGKAYLEELWEAHDWMEREIIREERRYSDKELDTLLER